MRTLVALALLATLTACSARTRGTYLATLPWPQAERLLTPEAVIVIPLGAASKEHGPHLPLNNDAIIARYLTRRIAAKADVIILPPLNYSYYPAFVNYPGSTSLRLETARDEIVDICRCVAHVNEHSPRRFYILNTGVSTLRALKPASEILAADGILMTYTDILHVDGGVGDRLQTQLRGTHADEIETSMMLYMAPEVVDMSRATRDMPEGKGPLTRDPNAPGMYSPSGIYGDATLATRAKGEQVVEAMVAGILKEIEATRTRPIPATSPAR